MAIRLTQNKGCWWCSIVAGLFELIEPLILSYAVGHVMYERPTP